MDTPIVLVTNDATERTPRPIVKSWLELPVRDDMLFRGTDERGRSGWFVRLTVGATFPRRVGLYQTKSEARDVLEDFMAEIQMELLLNLMNDMKGHQVCVVEEVPTLLADAKQKGR